jgi:hypothetical protein
MTEPRRLIEECDNELERQILLAGSLSSANNVRRVKVLAALGVGVAVASTSKTSFAWLLTWKKTLAAGAVGAVGATSVIAYQALESAPGGAQVEVASGATHEPRAQLPAVESRAPEPVLEAEPAVVGNEAPPVEQAGSDSREAPSSAGVPRRKATRSAVRPESARGEPPVAALQAQPESQEVPQANTLEQEVALLDEARSALHAGRTGTALERLNQHSARFPRGSLGLEAEVLRIEALAAAGRHAEASRRAKRILERSPNSIVAARLRRFVQD